MKTLHSRALRISLVAAVACGAVMAAALFHGSVRAETAGTPDNLPLSALTEGKQVYQHICQGCHMPDAKGAVGAGTYPALAGDPALASKQFMALTLLNGRRNMPAFGAKHAFGFGGAPASLTGAQLAAVINYVRTNFGNHYKDGITADEVTALDR